MPAAHETAYPRLKKGVTPADLAEVYTPTAEELDLALSTSTRRGARLGFLILLKMFPRLGYFALVGEVPKPIIQHIARCLGTDNRPECLPKYDESGTRRRHIIRAFLNVQPFNSEARALVAAVVREGHRRRKNRLYQAFQGLGRVVRTTFLLRYINDAELRRVIQAATNKSEAFNGFVQRLFFGGERLITENDRDRQRMLIKYNHLVANRLIFHNVQAQTRIPRQLAEEGEDFDDATLSRLSPYLTERINRFGKYTLNLDRDNPAPDDTLDLCPHPEPALATPSI